MVSGVSGIEASFEQTPVKGRVAESRTARGGCPVGGVLTGRILIGGGDCAELNRVVDRPIHGGLQGLVTENRFNQIWDYVKNRISAKPD